MKSQTLMGSLKPTGGGEPVGRLMSSLNLNTVIDFFFLLRPKQKVADSELACEQAHQYLVTKAKTRWSDLSKVRK